MISEPHSQPSLLGCRGDASCRGKTLLSGCKKLA
jgi:hypothetical protein